MVVKFAFPDCKSHPFNRKSRPEPPVPRCCSNGCVFTGNSCAAQVEFDNTIETYFLEKDLKNYRQFLDQFGTDEIIAIAFGGEDIFTIDNLKLIDSISQQLETLPHVRRVISLTTADIVHGEEGMVNFSPLVPELPTTAGELVQIRQKALADPFIKVYKTWPSGPGQR